MEKLKFMKALSIKQPWASLIAHSIKDIENRTWKTNFRGRVYIHASAKSVPFNGIENGVNFTVPQMIDFRRLNTKERFADHMSKYQNSAIIGEVDIIDCVINHESIWADKTQTIYTKPSIKDKNLRGYNEALKIYKENKPIYNWVLANPILYDKPILNVKGKLSFWEFNTDDLKKS